MRDELFSTACVIAAKALFNLIIESRTLASLDLSCCELSTATIPSAPNSDFFFRLADAMCRARCLETLILDENPGLL